MISEPACTKWELRTWISNYVFLALTHRYAVIELAKFRSRIFWPASLYELFRLNMTNPNQGSNAEITLRRWLLSIKCTHSTLYKLVSIEILYWCIWATFCINPSICSHRAGQISISHILTCFFIWIISLKHDKPKPGQQCRNNITVMATQH